MNRAALFLAALLVFLAGTARAQLTIEITGGGGNQIPIAIAPFQGEAQLQPGMSDVVEGDLDDVIGPLANEFRADQLGALGLAG